MITAVVWITWSAATIAIGAGAWRMLVGPSLAARIAALDVVLMSLMGAIAVYAADRGQREWLDLLVIVAVIGFTATVAVSRFIEDAPSTSAEDPEEVRR